MIKNGKPFGGFFGTPTERLKRAIGYVAPKVAAPVRHAAKVVRTVSRAANCGGCGKPMKMETAK